MKIVGIIPARYASTRFPGKPLVDICGKPMIQRVFEQVKKVEEFSEIFVATDDARIEACCRERGIPVVMTREDCATPWHRAHEVAERVPANFYITINGDEPLIRPEVIRAGLLTEIPQDEEFGTNVITEMKNPAEVMDPTNIKVVFDDKLECRYMSRTPIPFPYKSTNFRYYKHIGVVGCNKRMLDFYVTSSPGTFERVEGIDSLRFVDYGKRLQFIVAENAETLSVDTPNDLARVRERIARGNI